MQYFRIANLNIGVDGCDFPYVNNIMKEYLIPEPYKIDGVIKFNITDNIVKERIKPFAHGEGRYYFETPDTQGFYDYVTEIDKLVAFAEFSRDRGHIEFDCCDVQDLFGISLGEAVPNVLGHLFREIILNNDGIVIHASTIIHNGEAITFTAPSGTGKSTHTSLWKKYYPETVIVNDDSPAIREIDGKIYAFGTPWSGKDDINSNDFAPLKAMVFVERSDTCSISEISTREAFIRMTTELPLSPFKHQSDLMFEVLNKLFSKVPSYVLKCDISKTAVETVKNKIFK